MLQSGVAGKKAELPEKCLLKTLLKQNPKVYLKRT